MTRLMLAAALALQVLLASAPAAADTMADIQKRGKLVVGVKKDVPLWGQVDPKTGELVGLEPDLAADLAARLGVKLELVGLLTAERIEAVEQRRVDVLIATLSDTPDRRTRLTLVSPHYYASGANVLARRQAGLKSWQDLRDRRVCGRRGAFYNRSITVTYGVDVVALYSNGIALEALRDGRCDAVLYDDTNIVAMLQEPKWSRAFEMPLPTVHVAPWSVAVHTTEAGGRLERLVSQAIADWHRTGRVMELERKWGIPVSGFTQRMNRIWNRRDKDRFYCGDLATVATPRECL
jgi:polar amino acid transport system substrate-binding protein